jgi:hypothetical protein
MLSHRTDSSYEYEQTVVRSGSETYASVGIATSTFNKRFFSVPLNSSTA